MNSELA